MTIQYLTLANINNRVLNIHDYVATNPLPTAPTAAMLKLLAEKQYIVNITYTTNQFYEASVLNKYAILRPDGWVYKLLEKDGDTWIASADQPTDDVFGSPIAHITSISIMDIDETLVAIVADDGQSVQT